MERLRRPLPPVDAPMLAAISAAFVLAHLLTINNYGFFRDEFYFVACSKRLALGYVDQPPLSAAVLAAVRWLLGDSLAAIRALPVVVGGLCAFLTGLVAREFGGGRVAQAIAALCFAVCPLYLGLTHFYSMNVFDLLFWILGLLVLVRLIRTENSRLWVLFGLIAGLGLLNKISVLFFGFGLVVGLLLTRSRKEFASPWFWMGGALAALIFAPHILWQVQNGWPTLEFMDNAQRFKMLALGPLGFIKEQIMQMNPAALPVWLAGLYYLFFNWRAASYRLFGWMYVAILILMIVQGAKAYYMAPVYPILFAAGGLQLERLFTRLRFKVVMPIVVSLLIVSGIAAAPMSLPVLPPESFIRYSRLLGIAPSSGERRRMGPLPQHFADMFGWKEMVASVAKVYQALPPEEKSKAAIFGQNYGEAGAVDLLGDAYGLPDAISGHNNYWLWGPRDFTGEVVIVIGDEREDIERFFRSVTAAGVIRHRYAMPYESNLTIWVARQPRQSLQSVWRQVKHYD
jgi:hypothetical protein